MCVCVCLCVAVMVARIVNGCLDALDLERLAGLQVFSQQVPRRIVAFVDTFLSCLFLNNMFCRPEVA